MDKSALARDRMKRWGLIAGWLISLLLAFTLGIAWEAHHRPISFDEAKTFLTLITELVKALAWPVITLLVLAFLHPFLEPILIKLESLKIGIAEIRIRPTAQPATSPGSIAIAVRESEKHFDRRYEDPSQPLPFDYLFLNHISYYRPHKQAEKQFQPAALNAGYAVPVFDFNIWLQSYYPGALELVDRVEYYLGEVWPNPIQSRFSSRDRFQLHELTWGEILVLAKVYFRSSERQPLVLNRWISIPTGQIENYGKQFNDLGKLGHSLIYRSAVGKDAPVERWEEKYLKWPTQK